MATLSLPPYFDREHFTAFGGHRARAGIPGDALLQRCARNGSRRAVRVVRGAVRCYAWSETRGAVLRARSGHGARERCSARGAVRGAWCTVRGARSDEHVAVRAEQRARFLARIVQQIMYLF